MMQRILILSIAILATLPHASYAVRVVEQIERSHELALGEVQLPKSSASAVVFKACETCSLQSLAVTSSTRYFVDGQELMLAEFTEQASTINNIEGADRNTLVMVHYSIATNIVTRIRISTSFVQ